MYEYRCKVVKIIDGDTVDVDIDLGFGVWLKKERIRLYAIDTPESRTRDLEEKAKGLAAKDRVKALLEGCKNIQLHSHGIGKFGRCLGEIYIDMVDGQEKLTMVSLNELLIKALNDGTLRKPLGWTPASKTLGFLRINFLIVLFPLSPRNNSFKFSSAFKPKAFLFKFNSRK